MCRPAAILLAVLTLAAGPVHASTKFITSWKAPDVGPITLGPDDIVLAMVMGSRDDVRNGAEAALAADLEKRGVHAVPAYTVIPKSVIRDEKKARPYVEKEGCTYAIIMRVAGHDTDISGSGPQYAGPVFTGPYYGGLYGGYWMFGWGVAFNAGNIELTRHIQVETLVYDLRTNKLVWAAMTDTENPDTVLKFMKDLVKHIGKEMKKQGLVGK